MTPSRLARRADGHFDVDLPPEERSLLRSLPATMRLALTEGTPADDPALARLNPKAYTDNDEFESEYRDLVGNDLDAGRLADGRGFFVEKAQSKRVGWPPCGPW